MSGRYAFTSRQRLLKAKEFAAVFSARRSLRSRSYVVMSCPNEVGHARLGMVVGKRQFRRAVDRNRMRRIIRETFRQYSPSLPALDVVVRVNTAPVDNEAASELADLLAKLK